MAREIGVMNAEERIKPKSDESIPEFYGRYRGSEIMDSSKNRVICAYNNLMRFIEESEQPEGVPEDPTSFEEDDVRSWCDWMLNENGQKPRGAENYLNCISRMMKHLRQEDYIEGTRSPFQDVKKADYFDYEKGAVWIEVEYNKLVDGVLDINHPRTFTATATLAKTGLRLGELVNQDESTINLDHNISTELADPVPEIADKPNTIRVNSKITKGKEHRGEVRKNSCKKNSHRTIPIDDELCEILGWYLSLKPRSPVESKPIFTGVSDDERVAGETIEQGMRVFVEKNGWGGEAGITPQFFRHWYVTNMRNNLSLVDNNKYPGTPKRIVKGLRGDSDNDTIETYSQDWNKGLEADVPPTDDLIRECIPKFFH